MLFPIIKELGRMPTAIELSNSLGGDPSGWGRILKEQCKPSGEYHARLKLLRDGIGDAQFKLQIAKTSKKYGERNRKGKLVPHAKDIHGDMNNFYKDQIIYKKLNNVSFEDQYDYYVAYCEEDQMMMMYEDRLLSRDIFEEQKLREDFKESLS